VRAHFTKLRTMRENLAAMGQPPDDNDFYLIILGSLPPSYDPHTSAISATSSVVGKTQSPDALMHAVTNEFDCRILSSAGAKEENDTFYSNDSGRGRKGGSSSWKVLKCFNCGKKGYFQADCWAEGSRKEGKGPRGRKTDKGLMDPPDSEDRKDEKNIYLDFHSKQQCVCHHLRFSHT